MIHSFFKNVTVITEGKALHQHRHVGNLECIIIASFGMCGLCGRNGMTMFDLPLCIKQASISLSLGLARFPSVQENRKTETRGDDISGSGKFSCRQDQHLVLLKTKESVRPVSSLGSV